MHVLSFGRDNECGDFLFESSRLRTPVGLLSGGERALTAIAILFAILDLKPTPFCILDEIEAALDDANIDTYADYLKSYSENTQFIVITHRKGTMERCDALYGVVMEEKGGQTSYQLYPRSPCLY